MNQLTKVVIAITAMMVLTPAFADEFGHEHRESRRHEQQESWHEHDIHRFHEHDLDIWRGGHWIHSRHQGRFAWWWVAGGVWYAYQTQIFPYPDPYMPPVAVSPPNQPAPNQFWYYCSQPQGYYPYTPQCQVSWQKVHAGVPLDAQR
jgi:hypothetical protein